MNLGHGHRRSVLILWTWTALLSAFVLYPVLTEQNPSYLPFGIAALAIALFTVLHPSVIEQRRSEQHAARRNRALGRRSRPADVVRQRIRRPESR